MDENHQGPSHLEDMIPMLSLSELIRARESKENANIVMSCPYPVKRKREKHELEVYTKNVSWPWPGGLVGTLSYTPTRLWVRFLVRTHT